RLVPFVAVEENSVVPADRNSGAVDRHQICIAVQPEICRERRQHSTTEAVWQIANNLGAPKRRLCWQLTSEKKCRRR
uniref:Uncharacterized protein n=1 Tax=Romanomermis culicivorax TaxID=13658 RepID=A0A915HHB9_ROMCU